jgi:DNA-binding transcriptional ArsR family regulator
MSMPAISKHLKVLEKAGLIERGRDAQTRPARLNPAALKTAADWIDEYRKFWEQSFDRLNAYLQRVQADNKETKRKRRKG